jgi:NAD(P)-dependent dehydrogenase (short-subunit alcohol dehydrogenase family)
VNALAAKTIEAFGAVQVVSNNAGVGVERVPAWEQTLEDWRWVLGVNLWGVIHGIRTFVPILLRQGDEGHVIDTASMAGHLSLPLGSVYHATKFAVVTISESLYYELEKMGAKVKVSVLCPWFVRTNIMDSARNRPPELAGPARPMTEGERALREAFRRLVTAGKPPSEVADLVLEAIREERFYIFPHPEMLANVRVRMENILAQQNPTLELPEELRRLLKS